MRSVGAFLLRDLGPATEVEAHAAEANGRNLKAAAAEFTVLHCHFLSRVRCRHVVEDLASDTDGSARGHDDFRVAHGAATLRRGSFSDIPSSS